MIRSDSLPISRDEMDVIRGRLTQAYAFEVLDRDGARYVFLRSPRNEPDPVADLEACLERLPDWAAAGIHDFFILGTHASFHIPGHHAQPYLERRTRIDLATVQRLRNELDRAYTSQLLRLPGDPLNLVRLGLRVPRTRVADLDPSDLTRLARSVGPLIDSGDAARVQVAYLVADEDHLRLLGEDIRADLAPRWTDLQRAPSEPVPEPEPPIATPPPPLAPRRRPKKVIQVRPVLELEANADASTFDELARRKIGLAETTLEQLLKVRDFDVMRNVTHGGTLFSLAAERTHAYPHRVLVQTHPEFRRADADEALRCVRDLDADLLIIVSHRPDEDAVRRTLATKVKVIRPNEVASVSL